MLDLWQTWRLRVRAALCAEFSSVAYRKRAWLRCINLLHLHERENTWFFRYLSRRPSRSLKKEKWYMLFPEIRVYSVKQTALDRTEIVWEDQVLKCEPTTLSFKSLTGVLWHYKNPPWDFPNIFTNKLA